MGRNLRTDFLKNQARRREERPRCVCVSNKKERGGNNFRTVIVIGVCCVFLFSKKCIERVCVDVCVGACIRVCLLSVRGKMRNKRFDNPQHRKGVNVNTMLYV